MNRFSFTILSIVIAQTVSAQSLFVNALKQQYFPKNIPAGNYSGMAHIADNDYAVVSDKSSEDGFFVFNITTDAATGRIMNARNKGFHSIGTNMGDLEAVAYDSKAKLLYICSEAKNRVVEYDMTANRLTGNALDLSAYYDGLEGNGGIESLCYDNDTQLLWTINEKPQKQDTSGDAYILRLMSFDKGFHLTATYPYLMDAPKAKTTEGCIHVMGVSEIAAVGEGNILVLEREFYVPKMKLGAYCICKIYIVRPSASDSISYNQTLRAGTQFIHKEKLTEWTTSLSMFGRSIANYEGMCLGPQLNNGNRLLMLVADSQNQYRGVLRDWFKSIVLSPTKDSE